MFFEDKEKSENNRIFQKKSTKHQKKRKIELSLHINNRKFKRTVYAKNNNILCNHNI